MFLSTTDTRLHTLYLLPPFCGTLVEYFKYCTSYFKIQILYKNLLIDTIDIGAWNLDSQLQVEKDDKDFQKRLTSTLVDELNPRQM